MMSGISDAILCGISGLRWSVIGKVDYGSSLWVWWCSVSVAAEVTPVAWHLLNSWNATENRESLDRCKCHVSKAWKYILN